MKNSKLYYFIFTVFITIFFFLLTVIMAFAKQYLIPILPPTSENPYGAYNMIADQEMSAPTHAFQERPEELGSDDLKTGYFSWSSQNISSMNVLNTLAENDFPILKYDFNISEIYPGAQLSMEPSEFIYRFQMDGVNLFGGGYIPYNDFFYTYATDVVSTELPPDNDI